MTQKTLLSLFIVILFASCCIPPYTLSWKKLENKTILLKSGKEIDPGGDKENINSLNLAYLDCVEQHIKLVRPLQKIYMKNAVQITICDIYRALKYR